MSKIVNISALSRYNDNIQAVIDSKVQKLMTDTEIKFFCIEPVTIVVGEKSTTYEVNTLVDVFLKSSDEFEVITTSNSSIASLYAWPGALDTYYEWLEGVNLFDGTYKTIDMPEMPTMEYCTNDDINNLFNKI